MRNTINKINKNSHLQYRGERASRVDNLTDAVFGIAITLLIFNLANPNSFDDLITFTKTLPAFLISIGFIILIWNEHLSFSVIFSLDDVWLKFYNTLFLALVIFYVYPLRFLTFFLTNFFFKTEIEVQLQFDQVPLLMIYYGAIISALYLIVFMFYHRAGRMHKILALNPYEKQYTYFQKLRLAIMFSVPLLSILVTFILKPYSFMLASVLGGLTYLLYFPAMIFWYSRNKKAEAAASIADSNEI